jgi:hypothetical protein
LYPENYNYNSKKNRYLPDYNFYDDKQHLYDNRVTGYEDNYKYSQNRNRYIPQYRNQEDDYESDSRTSYNKKSQYGSKPYSYDKLYESTPTYSHHGDGRYAKSYNQGSDYRTYGSESSSYGKTYDNQKVYDDRSSNYYDNKYKNSYGGKNDYQSSSYDHYINPAYKQKDYDTNSNYKNRASSYESGENNRRNNYINSNKYQGSSYNQNYDNKYSLDKINHRQAGNTGNKVQIGRRRYSDSENDRRRYGNSIDGYNLNLGSSRRNNNRNLYPHKDDSYGERNSYRNRGQSYSHSRNKKDYRYDNSYDESNYSDDYYPKRNRPRIVHVPVPVAIPTPLSALPVIGGALGPGFTPIGPIAGAGIGPFGGLGPFGGFW